MALVLSMMPIKTGSGFARYGQGFVGPPWRLVRRWKPRTTVTDGSHVPGRLAISLACASSRRTAYQRRLSFRSRSQPAAGKKPMYKHILIATDGSELAGKAVIAGLELAKHLKSKAATVTEPWTAIVTGEAALSFPLAEYDQSVAENAARILAAVSDLAKNSDVDCAGVHAKDQYPADGILEPARTNSCDLIVMASHGRRGLGRLLLGSAAVRVLTHSTLPVLICR